MPATATTRKSRRTALAAVPDAAATETAPEVAAPAQSELAAPTDTVKFTDSTTGPLSGRELSTLLMVRAMIGKDIYPAWTPFGWLRTVLVEPGEYLTTDGQHLILRAGPAGKSARSRWTISMISERDGAPVKTWSQQLFRTSADALAALGGKRDS